MHIVRRLSDGLVQYVLDGEAALTEDALVTPKFKASDIKSSTHEIVYVLKLPPYFRFGSYAYNDGWIRIALSDEERAVLISAVKKTAEAKILAILPEYKQRNLTARAAELAIIRQSRPWTEDEVEEYTVGQALWDRIKAIRAYSNQLEAQLDAATTIEEFDAIDITAGWPE